MKIADLIPENELKDVVMSEFRRRLVHYRYIDELMKKKYGMTYEEFDRKNMVKRHNFSWPVEEDAMKWEHAIEGIRYIEAKLKALQGPDVQD